MANRPKPQSLEANSIDVLNAIRNTASANYRDYVPVAVDESSVREIGAVIMTMQALQNEFLTALVNRIGMVIITSKMYENPWQMFKKGLMEFGETIEEIFVNIARPFEFDPAVAEKEVFKRETPDVRAAFHVLNYQKMYKSTVTQAQLRQAFLSVEGLNDLITKIIEAMYSGMNYDEFLVFKYNIARHLVDGHLYPETIPAVTDADMGKIVKKIKGISNNLEFMSPDYNLAGVYNYTMKENQYLIMTGDFDAAVNIDVLAAAFNMDKAEFSGHTVLVDGFGKLDQERLAQLFEDDANYRPLTDAEIAAVQKIPAVLLDIDWFMLYDNLIEFSDIYNPQGLYWNYFLHAWKIVSVSPFANSVAFIPGTPSVTSVTVTPAAVTTAAGQTVALTADVVTENFAPKSVTWSSSSESATVDIDGNVKIAADAATGDITITATSTFDSTKSGTAKITVA